MKTSGTKFSPDAIRALSSRAANKPVFVSDKGEVLAGISWKGKVVRMLECLHIFSSFTQRFRQSQKDANVRAADVVYNTLARQYGADVAREASLAHRRSGGSGPMPIGQKVKADDGAKRLMTCGDISQLVRKAEERATTTQLSVVQKSMPERLASKMEASTVRTADVASRIVEQAMAQKEAAPHDDEAAPADVHEQERSYDTEESLSEQEEQQPAFEEHDVDLKEEAQLEAKVPVTAIDDDVPSEALSDIGADDVVVSSGEVAQKSVDEETVDVSDSESVHDEEAAHDRDPESAHDEEAAHAPELELDHDEELPVSTELSDVERGEEYISATAEDDMSPDVAAEEPEIVGEHVEGSSDADSGIFMAIDEEQEQPEVVEEELVSVEDSSESVAAETVSEDALSEDAASEDASSVGQYSLQDLAGMCHASGRNVTPRSMAVLLGKEDERVDVPALARTLTLDLHGKDNVFLQDRRVPESREYEFDLYEFLGVSRPEEEPEPEPVKEPEPPVQEKPIEEPEPVQEQDAESVRHEAMMELEESLSLDDAAMKLARSRNLDAISIDDILGDDSTIANESLTRLEEAAEKHGPDAMRLLHNVVKPLLLKNQVKVEFRANDAAMETGAYFIPRDNIIAVKDADVLDSSTNFASVVDDILFESFNANFRDQFLALEKEKNPVVRGTQTALIEFEATLGYVKELNTIEVMNMPMTERAHKALGWAMNILGPGEDLAFLTSSSEDRTLLRYDFLTSPHDKQATEGEATMPSREFYQHQAISDLSEKDFVQLLEDILPKKAPTPVFGTRKNKARDPKVFIGWVKNIYPTKESAERRPAVYSAVLQEAIKQFGTRFEPLKPLNGVVQYAKEHGHMGIQSYSRYIRKL